jgi:hypothetical protein
MNESINHSEWSTSQSQAISIKAQSVREDNGLGAEHQCDVGAQHSKPR